MKRLSILTIRSYLGPFTATFFIVLFALIMQFLWKYVDELVGKGLEFSVIMELLFYTSATIVPTALPLAILMAAVMTFGKLGEQYELVALKAAGMSLPRIMRPLTFLVIGICAVAYFFSAEIVPLATFKMKSLITDVRAKKPALDIQEKAYYKGIDGFVIRVNQKDEDTQELFDVTIYDHRQSITQPTAKDGKPVKQVRRGQPYNDKIIRAAKGKMNVSPDFSTMRLDLYDGFRYQEETDKVKGKTYPLYRSTFDTASINFSLDGFDFNRNDHEKHRSRAHSMCIHQLDSMIDKMDDKMVKRQKDHIAHLNNKIFYLKDTIEFSTDTLESIDLADESAVDSTRLPLMLAQYTDKQNRKIVATAVNLSRTGRAFNRSMVKEFENHKKSTNRYRVEWHRKWTLSVACLILFFIGAPMGAIIKKGGLGLPMLVSVGYFLVYYVISISGEKAVKQGAMEAGPGMWLASIILLPIGLFLMYMASTDSRIMDMETYTRFFNKLLRRH